MAKDDLRKTLERTPSPVTHTTDRPPSSIDPEKLLAAWNVYHAANMRLIEQFEEAREELKATRADNLRTRRVTMLVAVVVALTTLVAMHRGAQVLDSNARVETIAKRAGEQISQVQATLATVVETVALSNEAALVEAVAEPPTREPDHPPKLAGRPQEPAGGAIEVATAEARPVTVTRRLEAQKRAVEVLEQLSANPEVKEGARDRLVALEEAIQGAVAAESANEVLP